MAEFLPDDIDFGFYLDKTEHKTIIKQASAFVDDVLAICNRKPGDARGRLLPWPATHNRIEFRPHEVTIWTGINGHGKSLVLGQTILSLIAQGAKACIASFEMRPARTLYRMCRQASTIELPDSDFVRLFHNYTDGRMWIYDKLGTVDSKSLAGAITYAANEIGINHFVVDSLMKCGIQSDGPGSLTAQKNFVDQLCSIANDTGVHVHLVAHARKGDDEMSPPGKFDVAGSADITNQVDNVLSVWRNKKKEAAADGRLKKKIDEIDSIMQEPDALLTCSKQRNGDWEGAIKLWFHAESTQFLASQYDDPCLLIASDYRRDEHVEF